MTSIFRIALAAALLAVLSASPLSAQAPDSGIEAAAAMEKALVGVIAKAEKSVVAIARVRRERPGELLNLEVRPDAFGGMRAVASPALRPGDPDFVPNQYATGVVVDPRGHVLTVYHALGEDSDYYVTTPGRKVFKARVIAADPRSDLAVLAPEEESAARIGQMEWTPIALGNADGLSKGQLVVALGNPFAIARDGQASASWGIIANLARKAPAVPDVSDPSGKSTIHHFGTLIQTDAKLNLGTSGGPLLNLKGEMIGMTTAIPAAPGYEDAAGYAVPVDATFRRATEALKQGREVEYGFLGVRLAPLPTQVQLRGERGTLVERVEPGMPAQRHGLRTADVITAVDGRTIHDSDDLVRELGKVPVDATVRLGLRRGTRQFDVEIELTKYLVRGKKIVTTPSPDWRGARIDYLTAAYDVVAAGRANTPPVYDAVAVTEVDEKSPAWRAGLRPGMLISHVERAAVRSPKEFRQAVSSKNGSVYLRVAEGDSAQRTLLVPGT